MTGERPPPAALVERAAALPGGPGARSDPPVEGRPNLLVGPLLDRDPPDGVRPAAGGYEGEGAAAVGLLSAAVGAAERHDARLHHPTPALSAAGPWLVLRPLGGRVSTVERGRATVTVEFAGGGDGGAVPGPDSDSDADPAAVGDRLAALLSAAAASHDRYPTAGERGRAFRRGLTTLSLSAVRDGGRTVELDAATTPATTAAAVRDRLAGVPGVDSVAVDRTAGVTRATPSDALRAAVERAHAAVRGDCEYVWAPGPTALSAVPGGNAVALGPGDANGRFGPDAADDCAALLDRILGAIGG